MKTQYEIAHGGYEDMLCVVELDHGHPELQKCMGDILEFLLGYNMPPLKDRLPVFLSLLAAEIQVVALENPRYNTYGVREEFNDREGWYPMDGSCGVDTLQHETIEWDYKEFESKEVSGYTRYEPNKY